jgi:OOP family OmpA-OmpF porin
VADDVDQCPGTPAGVAVNTVGCAPDGDADGVADYLDKCPGTVRGAKVDANGCELDGDKDDVVDRLDRCPNSRPGAQVDISGCEITEEIRLQGVNFQTNSDRLLPNAATILNDAAATLLKNPSIKVEVAGHTDSDGSAEYNESLSARRAATVRDYLINGGVNPDRITARGYGEAQPVASNATAEGKAENRRVVLRVTER